MIPANWKMPKASANPSWMASAGADSRNENIEETTCDGPVQRDEDREDQQDGEQPPEVLVPDERQVRAEATDAVHRKFTILLSATCTTRLMISGFPSEVFARMMISVADRGPSFMVASVSTDVTPLMFHCCISAASFS